jgi:hypothetical protein
MALPRPNPGNVRVDLEYDLYGRTALNTMWLNVGGFDAADSSDMGTLGASIYAAWVTRFAALLSNQVVFQKVKLALYATSYELEASVVGTDAGTDTGTPLPANLAMVASFNIPRIYRGGKPRIYVPGICEHNVDTPRRWETSLLSTANSNIQGFLDDVNALTTSNLTDVTVGVLSRYLAGVARTPPVFYPYYGVGAQPRPCTQRRRLGREA